MPSIEHLKKRAKLFLRWHRTGHSPVAAQIRATLPRYAYLTDAEILSTRFTLADAQQLVARMAGFESWHALRRHCVADARRATPKRAMTTFVRAEPQLFVRDLRASLEFYTTRLGFSVAFSYGEPPFYGQICRGDARLNLRVVDAPPLATPSAEREQLLSASIALDEAKPLFLEYQAKGVDFAQPLRSEPWGARTFIVRDPDGNLILFAGRDE